MTPLLGTTGVTMDAPGGGVLHERDKAAELFVAAVSTLGGDSAYETEAARDARIRGLTRDVALSDPAWTMSFTRWLREEGNIRRVPVLVACEAVKARLDAKVPDSTGPAVPGVNRTILNTACQRADEPSKIIAHWHATYGRALPPALKRGLGDAVRRLYNERSALKWDTDALEIRFGDVIELIHPKPKDTAQGQLFEWLLDRRHGRKSGSRELLSAVQAAEASRERSKQDPAAERERLLAEPGLLKDAGMTWENLSGMGPMDARAWEAMIPTMGYMALLRNLRNFDKAGISSSAFDYVARKLSDPVEVERSRQLPFRFYSAFLNADKSWQPTLNKALDLSVKNIPVLEGKTLVLVDCSGSMFDYQAPTRAQKAGLFAAVLKNRCGENVEMVRYGSTYWSSTGYAPMVWRGSVLETVNKEITSMGGTDTPAAIKGNLRADHDRLIIITDEQVTAPGGVSSVVPPSLPFYTWNIGGYRGAHAEATAKWHSFAGLTDTCFSMIPLIEAGTDAKWPFSV